MRKYLYHNKLFFGFLILIKIIATVGFVGFAFVMQNIVDFAANHFSGQSFAKVVLSSAAFCLCALMAYAINQISSQVYINRCIFLFRNQYYDHLLKQDYLTIAEKDSSKYLSDLTNNCNIIQDKYFSSSISLIDDIAGVLLSFVATSFMNWRLSVIMLVLTTTMLLIPLVLKKPIDQKTKQYSGRLENYTSGIKESLLGLLVIKSYHVEPVFIKEINEKNKEILKAQNNLAVFSNLSWIISFFVSYGLQIGMMAVAAYFVVRGDMTIGSIVAVLSLSQGFYGNIQNAVSRVIAVFGTKGINDELIASAHLGTAPKDCSENKIAPDQNGFRRIMVRDLTFRYKEEMPPVLSNISFTIEQNKKYLVLGSNGSGKSTLLKLIAAIYSPYEGSIQMDGMEYRELDTRYITQQVSYAQQEGYLFNKSLSDNIDLLGEHDDGKLKRVIHQAQLEEFTASLPNGIHTVVNEEVRKVSGGEKLRIMIARSLYHGSPILLLDEITSALDRGTSRKMEQFILSQTDKTIINVCHKFEEDLLKQYDEIIIMQEGRIVEQGTYQTVRNSELFRQYQTECLIH